MTLKEIAEKAGVSISTVSRVINNSNSKVAGKEVQEKIWKIVRESGYVPNMSARNLKMGNLSVESRATAKSIACIFARSLDTSNDPFFSQISRAIEREALKRGCIMKYVFSAQNINDSSTFRLITENSVDGVAVLGRFDKNLLDFIQAHYKYVVYTGLNTVDTQYDQIICDGYQAAISAIQYLYKLGHTAIGYVGEKNKEVRYTGYCDILKQLNLPLKRENIIDSPLTTDGAYKAVCDYYKKGNTLNVSALFCANDATAIGAMKALKEQGYAIPSDISIIGIDDLEIAQYVSPMLTTIHVPTEELGQMAAKLLIDRMENGNHLPVKVELPFYIAIRESCSPFTGFEGSSKNNRAKRI